MPKGTIKYFNQQKGFGLIKPHDGSTEIIFHQKDTIELVSVDEKWALTTRSPIEV